MLNPQELQGFGSAALSGAIEDAFNSISPIPEAFGVALSGGADSAMLAVHATLFARQRGIKVHFFHVHHGLQPIADRWQDHVHDLAHRLGVACHTKRVAVDLSLGDGIEAAARTARYEALAELARTAAVCHVLLAHHRNDQAETVFLRLLRGAGPTGLSAMAPFMERHGVIYLRPWLGVDRRTIVQLADQFFKITGWQAVQDPTNVDDKYTRAALRQRIVPELNARWPGWQENLLRHARLAAEVTEVLDEVAAQDFAGLDPDTEARSFSLRHWREMTPARQALVLRYWLSLHGHRMPSKAKLHELMRQLRTLHALGHDRQLRLKHGQVWICCVKGRVLLQAHETQSTEKG